MPPSPAALLVAAAALALALLAATTPAPNSGPGPTAAPSAVPGELREVPDALALSRSAPSQRPGTTGSDAVGTPALSLAHAPAGRRPAVHPLGPALTEALRIAGHPAPPGLTLAGTSANGYLPPVDPAVVVALFDAPAHPWSPGHRGVDLAAPTGGPVRAPADGVVVFAGTVVGRGVMTVLHPDGLRSSLEPVEAVVDVGTQVSAGQVVGTVQGASHCGAEACLHWGVRRGEAYVDPLDLVRGGGPTVLLPVP